MDKDFYPQLCGGVFFNILLGCRRRGTSVKSKMSEGTDGLSEPHVLSGLIKIFYPEHKIPAGRSFAVDTTNYKQCIKNDGANLPFNDVALIGNFDDLVKKHYTRALERMVKFSNAYLDSVGLAPRINYAITMIIATISNDKTIDKSQLFYTQPNGIPITKEELCGLTTVYAEPFLLGVWHFIITQRQNNLVGADTLAQWMPDLFQSSRGEYPFRWDRTNLVQAEKYILPETHQNDYVEIDEEEMEDVFDYTPYLQATKNKFSELKTLLYNDRPRKFYDFYVCNHICPARHPHRIRLIPDIISLTSGFRGSPHVVITGSGGLGKSMMMRHLLLDAIDNYSSTKLVPVFVPLKDYGTKYTDIFEYIFECLKKSCNVKKGQLEKSLKYGEIVLLLDGLDEIKIELVNGYKNELDKFIDNNPNTRIIMSSRPFQDFVGFRTFVVLELQPFTKDQALELIDKLEFRPDEPDFKEKFRKELDTRLYDSHREFANNPLLLTIMLMTFEQFAEIPSKMHVFYREAYLALSQKHDASKGGYKRELKTKLSADRFSDYLSEFCMKTYHDEKFELTREEFVKYFNSLKEKSKVQGENVTASDFLNDLISGMCILYYESNKYHFTHRSFQEYFCALFFSKQKDRTLERIGEFFEQKKNRMQGDMTFNMLYDMIPGHVEEYILLPYLTKLFTKCEEEEGYWTYLRENYDSIAYDHGNVNGSYYNTPSSFLMQFVIKQLPNRCGFISDLPFHEEFVVTKYVEVEFKRGRGRTEIVEEELATSMDDDVEIIDDEVGYNLSADIDTILDDKDYYMDMIDVLDDDSFELKIEYNDAREYWEQLKKKQVPLSDDFFDIF